jgi:hypothetical protein
MGYNLIIGEAVVTGLDDDDCYDGIFVRVWANSERDESSPAFNEPTDFTNERWPSYTMWSDFINEAGLRDFMFDENNMKGGHPGAFELRNDDIETTKNALERMRTKYPEAAKMVDSGVKYSDNWNDPPPCDGFGSVARATWLYYWVKWSVENCKKPVFANS